MYLYAKSELSGKSSEAYLEYYLEANVASLKANLPLFLRRRGTDAPTQDLEPQSKTLVQSFKTPRLLSNHAETELTFRQKSSRFFRPSETPRYTFSVKVEPRTVIQLEHPEPLPLEIAIVPNLNPDQTTICADGDLASLPPVNLTSIRLELIVQLDIHCPGTFYDHENDKTHTVDIPFCGPLKPFPIAVISPSELKHVISAPDCKRSPCHKCVKCNPARTAELVTQPWMHSP